MQPPGQVLLGTEQVEFGMQCAYIGYTIQKRP
jgi:hypothetical protein